MPKYQFEGPEKFAKKVANETGHAEAAGELKDADHVRKVADLIDDMQDEPDAKAKDKIRQEVEECLDRHDREGAVARAMVDEVFPTHNYARPNPVIGRIRMSAREPAPITTPGDPRKVGAVFGEQRMGPDGNPITLDPGNPEHHDEIRRIKSAMDDLPPSEILAMQQSQGWAERAAARADAAMQGYSDRDLIVGSPNRGVGDGGVGEINVNDIDREFDMYMDNTAGQKARAEAARMARLRAVGADVGMTGGPPRPNTGVNQDINQVDVPTQYDEPNQVTDPFQRLNPPYIDPNQTDYGQAIKRPQGPLTGTGLTETAMKAEAGVPHDQVGSGHVDPREPLTGKVPPEAEHPQYGGGTGKTPPPTSERRAGKK